MKITENEIIDKRIKGALTVGELKKIIKDIDNTTPLVVVGHYGEAHFIDLMDVYERTATVSASSINGTKTTRIIDVLNVDAPDIGPEPD